MSDRKMWLGVVVSVLWLIGWAGIAWHAGLANINLDQWGGFLSGIVAPLAFLWLILGYLQQGEELKLNTRALERQERELARTAGETADLVQQTVRSAAAMEKLAATFGDQAEQARVLARPALVFQHRSSGPRHIRAEVKNFGASARNLSLNAPPEVENGWLQPAHLNRGETASLQLDVGEKLQLPLAFTITGFSEVGEALQIDLRYEGGTRMILMDSTPPGIFRFS